MMCGAFFLNVIILLNKSLLIFFSSAISYHLANQAKILQNYQNKNSILMLYLL